MKIICPKCASQDVGEPGKEKAYLCRGCGHDFDASEGLVSFADAIFLSKALNHPLRRAVLLEFAKQPQLSANELHKRLDEPLGNVAYHVRVLRELKPPVLIKVGQQPRRGAIEKFYRVNTSIA